MKKIDKEFIINEYLTIDELAIRWKKNKFTIYNMKDKNKDFPKQYKFFGGRILFKIKEVIDFEEKHINVK